MKAAAKEAFTQVLTNRYLVTLLGVIAVLTLLYVVYIGFSVRPSELQLVSHYTAYGVTNFYRSQWFYLFTFGGFGLLAAVVHIGLAVKLYVTKGPSLALLFAWMGIGTILFAWLTSFVIINIW